MKDIRISNFRCYDDKTMDFRKGINLLIGDNSSGKIATFAMSVGLDTYFDLQHYDRSPI